jgi:PDZ domain-containing protein
MRAGRGEGFPTGGEPEPPPSRDRWRTLLASAPLGALLVCLYLVPLPLFVEAPGPARDVLPRIDVDGAETYPTKGRLLLTTVNIGRASPLHAVAAWLDPAARLVPEADILPPGHTDRQLEELSLSQMDGSKIAAVAAALRSVTDYPRERTAGVVVQEVFARTPAAGKLFPGDLIVAAGGRDLRDLGHLREVIREAGTRRTLRLTVMPLEGGERRDVMIRPARFPDVEDPLIGIVPVANFPFHVLIASGRIGGPSAGLMWGLGLVDLLTPGDLTEGRTVAGTGELDVEGGVHGIGGIRLKLRAATEAGAALFLLPRDNLEEAREAGEDIRLVPVATLDEAVAFLEGEISSGNAHNPDQG